MQMDYVLQSLDKLHKENECLNTRLGKIYLDHDKAISDLKNKLEVMNGKTIGNKWKTDKPNVNIKIACDNSAFLQSLDEIEKKIDTIQNKITQLQGL